MSRVRLNSTPDRYIHTRVMNGTSCATSGVREPSRATTRARPALNTACSNSAGATSSQREPWLLPEAHQDDGQRSERVQHLLQLLQGQSDRQAGPGEVQGAHQPEAARDRLRPDADRLRGERPDEHAGDEERDEVRNTAARAEQQPEHDVVDGRVEQRRHHLPELAQPRGAVLRGEPGRGEGGDELPTGPQLADVARQGRPRAADGEPVALGRGRRGRPGPPGGAVAPPRRAGRRSWPSPSAPSAGCAARAPAPRRRTRAAPPPAPRGVRRGLSTGVGAGSGQPSGSRPLRASSAGR